MSGETELTIIVHGGAGNISQSRHPAKLAGVQEAVRIGYQVLQSTNNSVDAVEAAIKVMELDEGFNAGYGSVLTNSGDVEMDAILIRGSDLKAGAVGAMKHVQHPISVCKAVMEKTSHVGDGAEQFAKQVGFELVDSEKLISPRSLELLKLVLADETAATNEIPQNSNNLANSEGGTVVAVAINSLGQIATGTSTGGIAGKLPGRVGDTPIIGGGTFCDDLICGASATGLGEAIMRTCVCSKVANFIEQGENSSRACLRAVDEMTCRIPEGDGGVIVITKTGQVGYDFNSKKMAWAYVKQSENKIHYGIEKGDDFITTM